MKSFTVHAFFGTAVLWLNLGSALAELPKTITLRDYFGTMNFDRPVLIEPLPGKDSAYLVLENAGSAVTVQWGDTGWVKSVFNTFPVRGSNTPVTVEDGGLLGFAFHPDYPTNRKYYAYYVSGATAPGYVNLVEGEADSTLRHDSGKPLRLMLRLTKSYLYHNGGTMHFGEDGYLYLAVGDGGFTSTGQGDPLNHAQAPDSLFGKFLRLDVDAADAFPADTLRNYGYPADNPFVDSTGWKPEIWALGVRSPWKWSFHPVTHEIWLGDVGENTYEEVSVVPKGGNMGWKIRESAHCYPVPTATCNTAGLTDPVMDLGRSVSAVVGGVFFEGDTTSPFHNVYFYGDNTATGKITAVKFQGKTRGDSGVVGNLPWVSSFNTDAHGRIFAVSFNMMNAQSTANAGRIRVMESPDFGAQTTGASPRLAARRAAKLPSARELVSHRSAYEVFGLDGRRLEGIPAGLFLVRKKGSAQAPLPMSLVR